MKKLTFFRVISLLIVTVLVLSGSALAEDTKTADVEFAATEADGMVELEVTVKNATFMVFQVAVRYDNEVVLPIDDVGNLATEFEGFSTLEEEASFLNEIGLENNVEKGLFGFTVYIMPGTRVEGLTEKNEYVADGEGLRIYKMRFKRIAEGLPKFEIAFEDESKPYQSALKEGLLLLNYEGHLDTVVSFVYNETETHQTTVITPKPTVTTPEATEPEFTSSARKKDVICLQIGKNQTIAFGKKKPIDPDNELVVPYIVNDRTLVPLRFVAETLGAEVLWEEGWNGCIVKNGDTEIEITFGSAEFKVNGETVTYEAPIEVVHDRTMVPVRFISETFGNDVYWNEKNSAVVISPADNPWVEGREAESTALGEMLITIMGIFF